jgi:hypothetical protein
MEEWLHVITEHVVFVIDTMALIIVAVGSVEVFFSGLRAAFSGPSSSRRVRDVVTLWARPRSPPTTRGIINGSATDPSTLITPKAGLLFNAEFQVRLLCVPASAPMNAW